MQNIVCGAKGSVFAEQTVCLARLPVQFQSHHAYHSVEFATDSAESSYHC